LGEAHGVERVGDRELLELLVDARFPPQPRGVVELERLALPVEIDGNGIARDAGLGARQQPLLADEAVDQRRLAGVRPADDGDADRMRAALLARGVLALLGGLFRQRGDERVVEIDHALVVLGRDADRPAEPDRPSHLLATSTIGLPDLRATSAKARSAGIAPARASIMKKIASACAIAVSVCTR